MRSKMNMNKTIEKFADFGYNKVDREGNGDRAWLSFKDDSTHPRVTVYRDGDFRLSVGGNDSVILSPDNLDWICEMGDNHDPILALFDLFVRNRRVPPPMTSLATPENFLGIVEGVKNR